MKILILLILLSSIGLAQNSQVTITGKIVDKNGQKVSGELRFVSSSGVIGKTKISSDETYTFACKSGDSYSVTLLNYILDDKDKEINVSPQTEFKEFNRDLKVERLVESRKIMSFNAFKASDSTFQSSANSFIKELSNFVKSQPNISYNLNINMSDCKFKPIKSKKTVLDGKKKKTITTEVSIQEQSNKVFQARINSIKAVLLENKIRVMSFTFLKDEKPFQATNSISNDKKGEKKNDKSNKKSTSQPNVLITISKIREQ